ncbi:EF-hand domain-containing protein [Streptomyces sp. NPDC057582]|uniref:EF-hand domain-containing protein n=1 Tax=Streptomyces sp. NPDC057582 TaxID=3346174 RepID=UPI0036B9CA0D
MRDELIDGPYAAPQTLTALEQADLVVGHGLLQADLRAVAMITSRCDKGQALYTGAEAFWQGMAGIADVDGDQRVTREEFVGGAVKRLRDSPERFAEIARPFLRAAIAVADNDDDGAASVPAVERALKVLGASEESAGLAARSLDTDHDGKIAEDDAVAAFAVYFTVIEPDA